MSRSAARWGFVVVLLAAVLQGCGARDSGAPPPTAGGAGLLNTVSVDAVLSAIKKAGLPAVNAHDATASTCPEAGCVQAIDTDTVSILKFPSTGRAEIYAGGVRDMLQVEDVVVVFAPNVSDEQKAAYGQVVKNAMR
ncbi:hypothetical protein ORI20_26415 [Mycobacterium sp. CVI_P3]|uniref:Lipoprotein n=1 Tax=Mycobacterium pinniadriaticum TaxID=2994102 RepID=A0ABT3SL40_9MYCO|nr:hypothetical protein [Mycobacterium pinniadriaticum]MCX2933811.1 hypothetical protein [Mycobacterium pinniadriaticum]MCX2940233.1 hypothetical protein [Mycobacterium pinniadriaticum]